MGNVSRAFDGPSVGNLTGPLCAMAIAHSGRAARALLPLGLAIQSLPIVAPAPFLTLLLLAAFPDLFAAFQVGAATCIHGATVAEWVIAGKGLGCVILRVGLNLEIGLMWGAILVSSAIALAALAPIPSVERALCPRVSET